MATYKVKKTLTFNILRQAPPTESPDVLIKLMSCERDGTEHTRKIIPIDVGTGSHTFELDKYEEGNATIDQVVIQVNKNSIMMSVEGGIGKLTDATVPIGMLDMLTMKMVQSTVGSGIYVVSTAGMDVLKVIM